MVRPRAAGGCVALLAVLLGGLTVPVVGRAGLRRVAVLSASAGTNPSDVSFYDIAASGSTVVAAAASQLGPVYEPVFVFTEPSAGWGNESQSAVLTDALDPDLGVVSVSGPTVVSNEVDRRDEAVFVEPPGGWSGSVAPSARLVSSDGLSLDSADVSGSTIVADGYDEATGTGREYVFSEPAGGWSGTLHESAELVDSPGRRLLDGVIDGRTIFALATNTSLVGPTRIDVFSEPAGGWTGILQPSATLAGTGAPSPSGRYLLSGDSLFEQPRDGWRGTIAPVGRLFVAADPNGPLRAELSGGIAATDDASLGPQHGCPCGVGFWPFTEPPGGWRGEIAATTDAGGISSEGVSAMALDDPYLFYSAGGNGVAVFRLTPQLGAVVESPRVSGVRLTVRRGKPRLGLVLGTARSAATIRHVVIHLPPWLGLVNNSRELRAGLKVAFAGTTDPRRYYTAEVERGALSITDTATAPLRLTLTAPAIRATRQLPRQQQNASGGARKRKSSGELSITDSTGTPWQLRFTVVLPP